MKPLTIIIIGMALLAALAALCAFWLWFMIQRPVQWAAFSDRIDDFWVRKGIMSKTFSEKCKRFEQRFGRKLLIGLVATMLVGSAGSFLFFIIWIATEILLHK